MAKIKIGNVRTPIEYLKQFFAPAGFGLGASGKRLNDADDLDTTWQSGWYRWSDKVPNNAPSINTKNMYGYMRVDGVDEKTFVQTVYSVLGDSKGLAVTRNVTEGVFGEWEYINPPMVFNKEYRTTERRNGMPVYRKVVTYKPDATISGSFVVPHGIDNFDALVDVFATINATIPLPLTDNNYTTAVKSVESSGIHVSNSNPYFDQNYIWYFYLAYTKKD